MNVNNMTGSPCNCAIEMPTRITDHWKTLLVHIYGNSFCNKESHVSGVIISDLSDHYGTFIATNAKKLKQNY